jgi:hypothetical protein
MGENIDLKKIDPAISDKYERELREAGMPAELEPVKLKRDETLEKIILAFPELKDDLLKFKSFSEEIKTYIADQILKLYEKRVPKEEILSRLKLLVEKSQDFTRLDGTDSDKNHNPQMTAHEQEMSDIERLAEEGAWGHMERGEAVIKKEDVKKPEIIH